MKGGAMTEEPTTGGG